MIVARTPRLLLRRWERTDRGTTVHLYGDAETMRYFGTGATFTSSEIDASLDEQIAGYARYGYGNYAVVLRATGRVIGHAGVRADNPRERFETDCVIDRAYWRQGYGVEATRAAVARAVLVDGAPAIWGVADRENRASLALMRALGMTYSGELIAHGVASVAYVAPDALWRAAIDRAVPVRNR